jgi:hypothetical protein
MGSIVSEVSFLKFQGISVKFVNKFQETSMLREILHFWNSVNIKPICNARNFKKYLYSYTICIHIRYVQNFCDFSQPADGITESMNTNEV